MAITLGRDVYHYHLHVTYIPVVRKEIKWTKKCKDPTLVGTVKEVISQVNHSKKWECEKVIGEDGKERLEYSYSKLQDRYHNHMKAAGYKNFERGKVGSTAEHLSVIEYKTKMRLEELAEKENELNEKIGTLALTNIEVEDIQTEIENIRLEKSNLQADHDRIKNEVEGIKELKKLKVKTQEIKIPDKPTFGTNVKISYDDLLKLKQMADSYIANEEEIKNIRKRRTNVSGREKNATEKEKDLMNRENKLLGKEGLLKDASQVKTECDNLQTQLLKFQNQINALTIENNSIKAKIQEAYSAIVSIIQAIGTLKHSTENYQEYTFENLTPKQSTLLTALENFSVRLAEKNNLKEQADNMKKYVGIDENVKKELKFLEPKSRSSRGYDR